LANIEQKLEKLRELKIAKDELKAREKEINAEIDQIEYELIENMEAMGVDQLRSTAGTASLKAEMYPSVENIHDLVNWAYENGVPEILQKRVSKSVFDEYYEKHGEFPDGISTYLKKSISFRKNK